MKFEPYLNQEYSRVMTKGLRFIVVINIIWLAVIVMASEGSLIYSWRLILFGGLPLWIYLIYRWIRAGK